MLERTLVSKLLDWKQKPVRQPIVLNGARQTGKTFLLKNIFASCGEFRHLHYLDFERDPGLESIFDDGLAPSSVISNIGLRFEEPVDPATDLIVFDEVGSCDNALQSLKYFSEDLPHAFVIATGSNIGLLRSFPVGKVEMMELFPLTFEEFLNASASQMIVQAYNDNLNTSEAHRQLWSTLLDYCFVGGMPDAVNHWIAPNRSASERVFDVQKIHGDLLDGCARDFGKYSSPWNPFHIESIFRSVPRQLGKNLDGSVDRFRFSEPIDGKNRYAELRGPIDWLEKANLVSKNHPITHEPRHPLDIHIKQNSFKLFQFDVGLLSHMLGMSYQDHKGEAISYKGFIAENFVQNELIARGLDRTYSWGQNQAQIEFVIKSHRGEIVPVEVKSGTRTKAKSLTSYIKRYNPSIAIKLIGARGGQHGILNTMPLYYASQVLDV